MQPSCRIDKKYVDVAGNSGFDSVKNYCCRISAFFVTDNFTAGTFAPNLQLLGSGGTKGIAGGQHDFVFKQMEIVGQFADSSGFANTIDADDKYDRRFGADTGALAFVLQHFGNIFFEERQHLLRTFDFFLFGCLTDSVDKFCRCFHPDVTAQKDHFQFFQKVFVDCSRQPYQFFDTVGKVAAGLTETVFQSF